MKTIIKSLLRIIMFIILFLSTVLIILPLLTTGYQYSPSDYLHNKKGDFSN